MVKLGITTQNLRWLKRRRRLSGGDPLLEMAACNAALAAKRFDDAYVFAEQAAGKVPHNDGVVAAFCQALLAKGDPRGAEQVAQTLLNRAPLNQLFIALHATALRMLGDERYHMLYDYDAFVFTSPLDAPKGWKSAEAYLDDLIEGLDAAHQFKTHPFHQSVRHGSQISSINGSDHPALRAFRESCAGPVQRYIDRLTPGEDPLRSRNIGGFRMFSTFSVSLKPSGFHVNHVHPQGWLSSACHLRLAEDDPSNDKAGWLKFGEPGIATKPALSAEKYVKPEPGVMAIFPSYMWHGTERFDSGNARLTVASDIVPAAAPV